MATDLNSHILIVDDEPQVCDLMRDGLRSYGLNCTAVTSAAEARDLLSSTSFQVLVTDVSMPGGSGMDLLRHVRTRQPDCRVVLVTGYTDTARLTEALHHGAYEYVEKPFELRHLVEVVMRAASAKPGAGGLTARAAEAICDRERARQASLQSIRALVRAVEAKDPYTRRHSEQVTHYAVNLAEHLGLGGADLERVRTASMLHDVGKIGVPDSILTKPGPLTDEEFALVRQHPALGAEILENISVFAEEAQLVRRHHERFDGWGYPDGLRREEIPFSAQIINVADSIDAMLMRRTYKEAYTLDRVLAELRRGAGSQFDPQLAAAAVEWCIRYPGKLILGSQARRQTA